MRRPNRDRNSFDSSGARFFLSCPLPDRQTGSEPFIERESPTSSPAPDLNWLLSAYQRLSQQLELDNLLITLIEILLETAIISQAWLILKTPDDDAQWRIEVSGSLESNSVQLLESLPLETAESPLLETIVNRVLHTQTPWVLNDVSQQADWISHSPIQPLSLFCLPLQFQGKVLAILYLENHFIANAFTREFQELLSRLSPQMAIALNNAYRYENLNQKIANHCQALAQAVSEFKQTQKKLVQSEKMVALGQLIAGIAHEINTPLGAIYASVQNLSNALDYTLEKLPFLLRKLSTPQQEDFLKLLAETRLNNNIPLSFREERQFKRNLEQQLVNRGFKEPEMTAQLLVEMGISEITTPIHRLLEASNSTEILDTAYHLVLQSRNRDNIKLAVEKASKIVAALKRYVHCDRCDCMTTARISEEIDTLLTLYQHELKQGIQVSTTYQDLPEIWCYPDQLNQVWANLIQNAIHAMGNQGKLEIIAARRSNFIQVQIIDSGCGISPEIQNKIFEPFFTTKEAGVGTGLGLDIVRQIVIQHRGHIEVESQPGRTSFTVYLPIEKQPNLPKKSVQSEQI
ncbi:ATP-binding protein [Capilliphycus salinus ALCB114379]|uniref:ATP-binding protein n=1 Tax=Capilliphycus salinus TaxID=2768948 RepID=UPI0039A5C3C7